MQQKKLDAEVFWPKAVAMPDGTETAMPCAGSLRAGKGEELYVDEDDLLEAQFIAGQESKFEDTQAMPGDTTEPSEGEVRMFVAAWHGFAAKMGARPAAQPAATSAMEEDD